MKKLFRPYLAFLLIGSLLTISSCGNDDDPEPVNEEELITTVTIRLEPNEDAPKGTQTVEATRRDVDGVGGTAPAIGSLVLQSGVTYNATLTLQDEQANEDITEEIQEENTEHQFFYEVTGADVEVTPTDRDDNGRILGIESTVVTGAATTTPGALRIVLKHQPDGLKTDTSDINTGETDADVSFPLSIE
ncbi:hypothetical protein ACFSKU_17585 [Pontibacter silvestris]|uniref:Type 1 periplasmic binding fold superfamily protein n=1 Tax=Pontibacter silvestris TaxID=2305183 RepID=A0ABW4X2W3_9BACT|nr:hypothetical protein [Pontibacter silvestris]MCC9135837.1 hypothetical protein [Pontibacter silvestris]